MKFSMSNLIPAAIFFLLLTGCGGGGGSDAMAPANTTFPLQKSINNLNTAGFQKTVSASGTVSLIGISTPFTASLQVTESPSVSTSFAGHQALQNNISILFLGQLNIKNQAPITLASNYIDNATTYIASDYTVLGSTSSNSYCIAKTSGQYPATVSIGQTGSVVTFTCQSSSTDATPTGTETISYVVSAGTSSTTATVAIQDVVFNAANQQTTSIETDYLIDTAGNITSLSVKVSVSEVVGGIPLNFTAQ